MGREEEYRRGIGNRFEEKNRRRWIRRREEYSITYNSNIIIYSIIYT